MGALSSRTPILMGEPVAWPELLLVLLPPQAAASSTPASPAARLQRLRRLDLPFRARHASPLHVDPTLISPPSFLPWFYGTSALLSAESIAISSETGAGSGSSVSTRPRSRRLRVQRRWTAPMTPAGSRYTTLRRATPKYNCDCVLCWPRYSPRYPSAATHIRVPMTEST